VNLAIRLNGGDGAGEEEALLPGVADRPVARSAGQLQKREPSSTRDIGGGLGGSLGQVAPALSLVAFPGFSVAGISSGQSVVDRLSGLFGISRDDEEVEQLLFPAPEAF
jgi:hypothetical protein